MAFIDEKLLLDPESKTKCPDIKRVRRRSENPVSVEVNSEKVKYTAEAITTSYEYDSVSVSSNVGVNGTTFRATPVKKRLRVKTDRRVKKTGVLLVGIGGNNGTTVVGGLIANRRNVEWITKEGPRRADWLGSVMESSVMKLGNNTQSCSEVHVPIYSVLPTLNPNDIVISGWDINKTRLGDAMRRAQVFDVALQDKIYSEMQAITPLPSIYHPNFIAANQKERATNVIIGTPLEQLNIVRSHIRTFKQDNGLEKVVVLWTANTERCCDVVSGINDTADNILAAVKNGKVEEVPPSAMYCIASILEGCSYINGSPQNTFTPGIVELAEQSKDQVFLGGNDFKSGQTKLKSILVDFLVSAGVKPTCIVSYNHLGNNDGMNLSSAAQFRSKEISKSNVITDMVEANNIIFNDNKQPDHTVVIKYVPYVGDSKRAMDEYTSEIFMGGRQTFVIHNTCEDSLLAAPIILDLIILTELFERVTIADGDLEEPKFERMHPILSALSYLTKAPMVPPGTPVINALGRQKDAILNIIRACVGLPPDNNMLLEYKLRKPLMTQSK